MIINAFRFAWKVREAMITLIEDYLLYEGGSFPLIALHRHVLFEQIFTCYSSLLLSTGWTEIQFLFLIYPK